MEKWKNWEQRLIGAVLPQAVLHDAGISVEDTYSITFDYTGNSKIVYLWVQKFRQNG